MLNLEGKLVMYLKYNFFMLFVLGILGCTSKNEVVVVQSDPVEAKTEQALKYCEQLSTSISGGDGMIEIGVIGAHIEAMKENMPHFFDAETGEFKSKSNMTFVSQTEEALFGCGRKLDSALKDIAKYI